MEDSTKKTIIIWPLWTQISSHLMAFFIALLNGWQIIILRQRARKSSFDRLLSSLSSCELMVGIVGIVVAIAIRIKIAYRLLVLIDAIWLTIICYVCLCEYFHLIAITLDRALAIVAPLTHRKYITSKKILYAIVLCWVVPMCAVLCYGVAFFMHKRSFDSLKSYVETQCYFHISLFTIFVDLIFIVSYSTITYTMFKRKQYPFNESNERVRHQHVKTLFLCFSYTSVFVIATTPYVVVFIVPNRVSRWIKYGIVSLYALNSIGNSMIFLGQHYYKKRQTNSIIENS